MSADSSFYSTIDYTVDGIGTQQELVAVFAEIQVMPLASELTGTKCCDVMVRSPSTAVWAACETPAALTTD